MVSGGDENSLGTIDYAMIVPHLVKAVQQQQEQIETLQQLVNNQQQQIETLMSSS